MSDAGVSLMIMAFNEVVTLERAVRELHTFLIHRERPFEVVIIDDGSWDGTGPLADELADRLFGARVVHHAKNLGLGGVLRTGFAEARQDWVTFFPADGQFTPAVLEKLLAETGNADMVLSTLPHRKDPALSKFLSFAQRAFYWLLFGPIPRFQGVVLFRRPLLDRLPLKAGGRGATVMFELIIRASRAGARITRVGVEMKARTSGTSKVNNLRTVMANVVEGLRLRRHLGRS